VKLLRLLRVAVPTTPRRMAYAICGQTISGYLEHVEHVGSEKQHGEQWPEIRAELERVRAAMLRAANPERGEKP
jgi:hypothetical protein